MLSAAKHPAPFAASSLRARQGAQGIGQGKCPAPCLARTIRHLAHRARQGAQGVGQGKRPAPCLARETHHLAPSPLNRKGMP